MLKIFQKSLQLTIANDTHSFKTMKDFEFALAGRTSIPATKVADLTNLSLEELKQEARSIKKIEKYFVDILSRTIEDPGSIGDAMMNFDLHLFSQDHNWRDIIAALAEKNHDYDDLKRIAFVKYMQYLSARQDLIKHAYSLLRKIGQKEEPVADPNDDTAEALSLIETAILDSESPDIIAVANNPMPKLPKGEDVRITLHEGEGLPLLLSKHKFLLRRQDELELVDLNGITQQLGQGKNIIGRDDVCNITIDESYRDISRLHLVIETLSNDDVRITDLSSHGTSIPIDHLPKSLHPQKVWA